MTLEECDLRICPFAVVLSEEAYASMPHIEGFGDYVCVLHEVKDFWFVHYAPNVFTEIRPSTKEDLSFGPGIYCYDLHRHTPKPGKLVPHVGKFTGKILECVYDCDPTDTYDKSSGSSKEFLLLTDDPVPATALCLKEVSP